MGDFLIHVRPADNGRLSERLRARPNMADARVELRSFPWGGVVLQTPRGAGYAPWTEGDALFACVGRPRLLGMAHEVLGADGFCREVARRWRASSPAALFSGLSGMYALLHCHPRGFDVITDQMGFQPVYRTLRSRDDALLLGTPLEILAQCAGREVDFDPVSLGELLVYGNVTFPFTSREAVEELAPASHHRFRVGDGLSLKTTFWSPREEPPFASDEEAIDAVATGLREATEEATRGCSRVAVLLSGGMDSRTILAAVPPAQRAATLTYFARENRETDTAARIASAVSVPHKLLPRPDEFYAELVLGRATALLGTERSGHVHGFCIVDNGLQEAYDVVLSGQLSDTFLKHHFMPAEVRESLRPRRMRERFKRRILSLLGRPEEPVWVSPLSPVGRHLSLHYLQDDIREAVERRREARAAALRSLRPHSFEEWSRFWPCSRQDDMADIAGSMILFPFDSPFMHRPVVDVACRLTPRQRYSGWVAHAAFQRVVGADVEGIPNANTGLRPATSMAEVARTGQKMRRLRASSSPAEGRAKPPTGIAPWNDVSGSWPDWRLLQLHSPMWQEHRRLLSGSPAIPQLARVLRGAPGRAILSYDDDLPPTLNAMTMQLATVLDKRLRKAAGDVSREGRTS